MRGKRVVNFYKKKVARITPAHAGKTSYRSSRIRVFRDHPRACGENYCLALGKSFALGSPPRMRGKRPAVKHHCFSHGITPAHAGKTWPCWDFPEYRQDHPRACGENNYNLNLCYCLIGSPPRMRGKLGKNANVSPRNRITPAHAGKTCSSGTGRVQREDHPRACGENQGVRNLRAAQGGSPPRMRGKPRWLCR